MAHEIQPQNKPERSSADNNNIVFLICRFKHRLLRHGVKLILGTRDISVELRLEWTKIVKPWVGSLALRAPKSKPSISVRSRVSKLIHKING